MLLESDGDPDTRADPVTECDYTAAGDLLYQLRFVPGADGGAGKWSLTSSSPFEAGGTSLCKCPTRSGSCVSRTDPRSTDACSSPGWNSRGRSRRTGSR